MLVPYSWLKELIDVKLSPEELAERLTLTGLEVEGVFDAYEALSPAFTVRIGAVWAHPQASHLWICQVTDGKREFQVVCGAPNVREGLKTVFAPPETVLFTGVKIAAEDIRGVRSEGVLCSPYELGQSLDHSGIIELPEGTPLGRQATEILGLSEPILEVAITPNRGDCLSILGMAREVAAVTGESYRTPEIPTLPEGQEIHNLAQVNIEVPELCYRYCGRLIKNVAVRPSPFAIQKKLWMCGIRPINNVVDITNYILLLLGQPLHAFDFDLLEEHRIVVRLARKGEEILTLDGQRRLLDPKTMVIADAKRPVAIAGIIGGEETSVHDDTKNVFLESAWFNPSSIRLTGQRLRISTESSYRFERGVDPEGVNRALDIAAALLHEIAQGEVVPGHIDVYPKPFKPRQIKLDPERVSLYLQVKMSPKEMVSLLERVETKCVIQTEDLICNPPSFRHDLCLAEDLIEELARLYGYDRLPSSMPVSEIGGRPPEALDRLMRQAKYLLTALSFYEVINYSFISPQFREFLLLEDQDPRFEVVSLANPLSEEQSVMRTMLLPGLLHTAKTNIFRQEPNLRLFELGKVFLVQKGEKLPLERIHLAGLLTGLAHPENCHEKPRKLDFFDLKGVIESLLARLGVVDFHLEPFSKEPFLRPGVSLWLQIQGKNLGFAGQLRKEVLEHYDLKGPIYVFEFDFEGLLPYVTPVKKYRPLPKFPATTRDLTLILEENIFVAEILDFIQQKRPLYLEDYYIIDVYKGKPIPQGKKSITLRFIYRSPEKTLTDEEVNAIQEALAQEICNKFNAQVR